MNKARLDIVISKLSGNSGQLPWLPKNPRNWTKTDIDRTIASIERDPDFLEDRPLLAVPAESGKGERYIVFAGNLRLKACKESGVKSAPVVVYFPETDEDRETVKRRAMLDNGSFGSWDFDALANEWDDLPLVDLGVPAWEPEQDADGFGAGEEGTATEDDFDETQDEIHVLCAKGDVWQLGDHRLMCGDSTDAEQVALLMNGEKADLLLTDPPYGMHLDTDFSTIHGSLNSIGRKRGTQGNKYDKVIGDNNDFRPDLIRTIFDNFPAVPEVFIFGADYFAELLPRKNDGSWLCWDKRKESQADAIGSEFELIWSKQKHKRRMLRHDWFGFLSSKNQEDARNRVHPTQKPITLLADIITQWGKDCKRIVDLYGGSGSTLIAAEQLGRKCYMMELDPHYCDVIIARWEKLTGKKAIKIAG